MDQQFIRWVNSSDFIDQLPRIVDVGSEIGRGAQGLVFEGEYNGERAAIKVYSPGQASKRVQREASALKDVSAGSIVRLFWAGDVNYNSREVQVVVTSYAEGTPLDDRIQSTPLDEDEVYQMMLGVAEAVSALWQERIVHRDIKPSNIILRDDGDATVIDLGLARHLNESSLTVQGGTWGTPGYLSPEQARAVRDLTCKSDIFTLAIVSIESAMGNHPAHGNQRMLLSIDLHKNLPSPVDRYAHSKVLKSMLHPRPTKRPKPRDVISIVG
mgnify:CR=1 FL=1